MRTLLGNAILFGAFRFLVGEEAGDLLVKNLGITQFPFIGELAERSIGEGLPKEETETGSDGVIVESAGLLDKGQEIWRAKDGMIGRAESLRERLA